MELCPEQCLVLWSHPVDTTLALVEHGYEVSIEEILTFELDVPVFRGIRVAESSTFGLITLDTCDLDAIWDLVTPGEHETLLGV